MGVGYIIRPAASRAICSPAACLAYLVLAPAIKLVGSGMAAPFGFRREADPRHEPGEIRASLSSISAAGAVASAASSAGALPAHDHQLVASSLKDLRDSPHGQALTKLRPRTISPFR